MTPEGHREAEPGRLRRVEALYHDMLARPPHERAAALGAVGVDDPALAAEVRALLDQPDSAAGPLGAPAMEVAARLVSGASSTLAGRRIGGFEVQGLLGVGGMGEVYRARDTRLGRSVAIKILPRAFKDDPDRLARFEREARVLASLNHPNIGAVYGLEDAGDFKALVLELVEGEDLSQRIARGAIPIDEALPIARQIAEAIEAAHEQGVIHRDLKPANIKVRADGTVKVLDFGLAKAMERTSAAGEDPTESPTLTARATQAGMIIGTAAYMAPEQARGKAVDRRGDIWSFGVVLYEMLSGERAFKGDDVAATLAAVLRDTPPLDTLPASVPARIKRLLERCLDRDPKTRLRDIGEARVEIARIEANSGGEETSHAPTIRPRRAKVPAWSLAAVFVAGISLTLGGHALFLSEPANPPSTVRLSLPLSRETRVRGVAVSPDGRSVVLVVRLPGDADRLLVRDLASGEERQLPKTEGAGDPFWSPDSRHIGFFADGKIKRVDVSGGPPTNVASVATPRGGTWMRDDVILFSDSPEVFAVPAAGGERRRVSAPDSSQKENSHRWPVALPDGKHFLLFVRSLKPGLSGVYVGGLGSNKKAFVVPADSYAVVAPPDHILYVKAGSLMSQQFSMTDRRSIGEPWAIAADPWYDPSISGAASLSASAEGTLIYRGGGMERSEIARYAASGNRVSVLGEPGNYLNVSAAPAGLDAVVMRSDERTGNRDIFRLSPQRGATTMTQLTFDPSTDFSPVWSPRGDAVMFTSDVGDTGALDVYRVDAERQSEPSLVFTSAKDKFVRGWTAGGVIVLDVTSGLGGSTDTWILQNNSGAYEGRPLAETPYDEWHAQVSPDEKWIAYSSNESGAHEIYIQRFPTAGGKRRVSAAGGVQPRWDPGMTSLYYLAPDLRIMAVRLGRAEGMLVPGTPQALFQTRVNLGSRPDTATLYDVDANGSFLVANRTELDTPVSVILSWLGSGKGRPR